MSLVTNTQVSANTQSLEVHSQIDQGYIDSDQIKDRGALRGSLKHADTCTLTPKTITMQENHLHHAGKWATAAQPGGRVHEGAHDEYRSEDLFNLGMPNANKMPQW